MCLPTEPQWPASVASWAPLTHFRIANGFSKDRPSKHQSFILQGVQISTLTVPDIHLSEGSPAEHLRRTAAAVRVHLRWWGTHKTLTNQQKEEVGLAYAADARFLTAGKKLIDVRHEAFRRMTSLRTRIVNHWRSLTLPYVEAGLRLIKQADIEPFVHSMEGFRAELTEAEANLDAVYGEIKADARRQPWPTL